MDGPLGWLFARGWSIRMIICKRPVHSDDHLQKAGPSGWSFAKVRPIQMIICKRPVHPDDHLQEAGPSRWSFARGWSIRMIICKRPVQLDDHLQVKVNPYVWEWQISGMGSAGHPILVGIRSKPPPSRKQHTNVMDNKLTKETFRKVPTVIQNFFFRFDWWTQF